MLCSPAEIIDKAVGFYENLIGKKDELVTGCSVDFLDELVQQKVNQTALVRAIELSGIKEKKRIPETNDQLHKFQY